MIYQNYQKKKGRETLATIKENYCVSTQAMFNNDVFENETLMVQ